MDLKVVWPLKVQILLKLWKLTLYTVAYVPSPSFSSCTQFMFGYANQGKMNAKKISCVECGLGAYIQSRKRRKTGDVSNKASFGVRDTLFFFFDVDAALTPVSTQTYSHPPRRTTATYLIVHRGYQAFINQTHRSPLRCQLGARLLPYTPVVYFHVVSDSIHPRVAVVKHLMLGREIGFLSHLKLYFGPTGMHHQVLTVAVGAIDS